jgi:hypothetical protein
MYKPYFNIIIGFICILFIIYFIQTFIFISDEGFTSKITSIYRPYIRNLNQKYDTFVSNYGTDTIIHKLKKFHIY